MSPIHELCQSLGLLHHLSMALKKQNQFRKISSCVSRFICMCTHILTLSAICSFNTSMGTTNSPSPFSELRKALESGAWEKGLEKSIHKLHTLHSSKWSRKMAGGVRNLFLIVFLVKVDSVSHGVSDSYVIADCRGAFLGMASCCGNPLWWLLQWSQSTNI